MEDRLITIATYSSISDAYIFKNLLSLNGIDCIVDDVNVALTPPVPTMHDGGVRLLVREGDAARAVSILNEKRDNISDLQESNL